jgi:ArsR family transcriptional regulator
MIMDDEVKMLKAMADETRMTILRCLMNGGRCACTIIPVTGRAQPTISRHLKILEEAGILESRREGSNIWYRISSKQARQVMKVFGLKPIDIPETCETNN